MQKDFFVNIIFLLGINVLIKPFYLLVIDASVQNTLGTNQYGLYLSLFNLCYILQIINDLGITPHNTRLVSQHRDQISQITQNSLSLKLMLSLLYVPIVFLLAFCLGHSTLNYGIIFILCLNQVLNGMILYFRGIIAGSGRYRLDSFLSIVDKFLLIFLLSFLLWGTHNFGGFSIKTFVYAQLVSFGITLMISLVALTNTVSWPRLAWSSLANKKTILQALPFALIVILMTLYNRVDGIMLERMLDDKGYQAGVYAASFRLFDAANILGFLIAGLLLPMYSHLLSKQESIKPLMNFGLRFVSSIAIIVACCLVFYRKVLLDFIYTHSTESFYPVLLYLAISFIFISWAYIFGTALVANNSLKKLNILFFFGLVINLFLNFLMIPKYGAQGAAATTLITQVFVFIGQALIANKILKIRWKAKELFPILLFAIASFLVFYGLSSFSSLSWLISMVLGIITCTVLSFILRLLDFKSLKETISTKQL